MPPRAQTGKLRIGNDWSGVFIRGDEALLRYLPVIRDLARSPLIDDISRATLQRLATLLAEADEHNGVAAQYATLSPLSPEQP